MSNKSISAIIVAGGTGTRMQMATPKQFLSLGEKPVVRYSYDLFLSMPEITEIVVVCDPSYHHYFEPTSHIKKISFALPGSRRQDSVYNGFKTLSTPCHYVCIHDAARPFVNKEMVLRVTESAFLHGAATAGMPLKFTLKESTPQQFVNHTLDRERLWEIQTPQVIAYNLLKDGLEYALSHNVTVTDDVTMVELLKKQVKLVEGSPHNLKITVPLDLQIASYLLNEFVS